MEASHGIVAYTAAFGPSIAPHAQPIDPDIPLVCFTDQPGLSTRGYEMRRPELPLATARLKARYVKVMAHRMFPDAEWAIWFDASVRFKTGRLTELIRASAGAPMAIHKHSMRSCVYDEAVVCKHSRLDDPERIDSQIARYRRDGYPARAGLWENGLIVRKLTDARVRAVNEAWWQEIVQGSVRDQLSLPVVLRQLNIDVRPLADTVYDNPLTALARGPMSSAMVRQAASSPPARARLSFRRPQGRLFDASFYQSANPGLTTRWWTAGGDLLDHYLSAGWQNGCDPRPLFDASFYLEANPDVANAGREPLTHYQEIGAREGRDPHVLFDTSWYLAEYGDACRHSRDGALGHYLRRGWRNGCRPNRWFNPASYLRRYADVRAAGMEPLEHYLRFGIREARDPRDHPNDGARA
jgi:hypothetical protein